MVAPTVVPISGILAQIVNSAGAPLTGGQLQFWAAGSVTPVATYTDSTGAVANTNPVVLNTNGNPTSGGIWLISGVAYKIQLQTSTGTPIWTVDNIPAVANAFSYYGGTSTGSANAYALANPQITAYTAPFAVTFIANFSNTGPATLNINGLGTKNIYKQTSTGPAALVNNEIRANSVVNAVYDGTEFQIINPAGSGLTFFKSGTAISAGNDMTEDFLATITLPANTLGANGFISGWANYTCTNNGNAKTIRARYSTISGTQLWSYNLASLAGGSVQFTLTNSNATNAQSTSSQCLVLANAQINTTSAIDTTASTSLVLTGQKGSAGDALTLVNYLITLYSDGT